MAGIMSDKGVDFLYTIRGRERLPISVLLIDII